MEKERKSRGRVFARHNVVLEEGWQTAASRPPDDLDLAPKVNLNKQDAISEGPDSAIRSIARAEEADAEEARDRSNLRRSRYVTSSRTSDERRGGTALVHVTAILVSVTANLGINSVWTEISVKGNRSEKERKHTIYYFIMLIVACNVIPIIYLFMKRCYKDFKVTLCASYAIILANAGGLALLGLLWQGKLLQQDKATDITFYLCVLPLAGAYALGAVVYWPLIGRLRPPYAGAVLCGEAIASLIPHALGLVQGMNRIPKCEKIIDNSTNVWMRQPKLGPIRNVLLTEPVVVTRYEPLRFNQDFFYFIHAGLTLLCGMLLTCLWHCDHCRLEHAQQKITSASAENAYSKQQRNQRKVHLLNDCSFDHGNSHERPSRPTVVRQTKRRSRSLERPMRQAQHELHSSPLLSRDPSQEESISNTIVATSTTPKPPAAQRASRGAPVARNASDNRPRSFPLLMVLLLWISAMFYGPLSSVKSFSCLPVGNNTFLVGTMLCDVMVLLAAVGAPLLATRARLAMVIAFTALGTILLTYFVALIAFSRSEHGREDSPIFGFMGELLTTMAWIAIVTLFALARFVMVMLCRKAQPDSLLWFGCMAQVGQILGTIAMLDNINVCVIFNSQHNICQKKYH